MSTHDFTALKDPRATQYGLGLKSLLSQHQFESHNDGRRTITDLSHYPGFKSNDLLGENREMLET